MTTILNKDFLVELLKNHIGKQLHEEAEKIIERSVAEYEDEVRAVIAKAILVVIENSFSVERRQEDLVITVRHESR